MGILYALIVIFLAVLAIIILLAPGLEADKEVFNARVNQIWYAVNICRTAGLGSPALQLRHPKRDTLLKVDFPDADRVIVSLPLIRIEQQEAKSAFIELLSKRKLEITESIYADRYPVLSVTLDRKDETLGHTIASLYRDIFKARSNYKVTLFIWTLRSDTNPLNLIFNHKFKPEPDAKFIASSARFQGKSVIRIQMERIVTAASLLLYPALMILSYEGKGATGMCWAGLAFYSFFFIYRKFYKRQLISDAQVWVNFLYAAAFAVVLGTEDLGILQSIPSLMGLITFLINLVLALNIFEPRNANEIQGKKADSERFRLLVSFWALGGLMLFAANEWARRTFSFEEWVWFFAFVRIELMLAMMIIFVPTFLLFLTMKEKAKEG